MTTRTRSANLEYLPQDLRVHVVGAGPVGLLLTSLLQTMDGVSVHLYEKRREYTRTRMVRLAPYLVAESSRATGTTTSTARTVAAVFDPPELDEGPRVQAGHPPGPDGLLRDWTRGFCPLNNIEQSLSELIDARGVGHGRARRRRVGADEVMSLVEPGEILIDCTGCASLLRDHWCPSRSDRTGARTRSRSGSSTPS